MVIPTVYMCLVAALFLWHPSTVPWKITTSTKYCGCVPRAFEISILKTIAWEKLGAYSHSSISAASCKARSCRVARCSEHYLDMRTFRLLVTPPENVTLAWQLPLRGQTPFTAGEAHIRYVSTFSMHNAILRQ